MARKIPIDLYYDVMSPYAWIAFEGLLRYQQVWPISVNLVPFSLFRVFKATKNTGPLAVPNKEAQMVVDLERNNEFWGMDIKYPKEFSKWVRNRETTSKNAQKLLVAIQEEKPELLETVSREYWKRLWFEGKPIFTKEDHEIVFKSAGIPADFVEKLSDASLDEKLKKNTEAAVALGAFGTPWIVVHKDGKENCFFGSDRFHFIAHLIGETFTHGQKQLAKL